MPWVRGLTNIVSMSGRSIVFCFLAVAALGQQPSNKTAGKSSAQNVPEQPANASRSMASQVLQQFNADLQNLVAKVSPAVVQIQVTGYGALEGSNPSEAAVIARQQAIGAGLIVDSDGYIMTNAHVVRGAQRIRVVLAEASPESAGIFPAGRERLMDAKLIGVHEESDLALLKIDGKGLPTLSLRTAGRAHQGQLVLAIGSPQGLENTVTMGVVSSVARQPDPDKPMVYIQTDAPINPGNSGGPLIDTDGYVLGINTMILSQSGGSEGLGFAIPARVVQFVYESLRKNGHVHRVEINAGAQNITPSLAEGLGLAQSYGVIISDVTPGGPAESAGLQIGDIVVSADGRVINTLPQLTAAMYLHPLDEVLTVVVKRGNEEKTLHIPVIEQRDPMDKLVDQIDPEKSLVQPLGILAISLDDQLHSLVGDVRIPSGVIVLARAVSLLGPETGLKTGDLIHSVNRTRVDSLDSLRASLKDLKPGAPVVLQIERDDKLQWLAFDME
ncbi:MAG TPA: trypsin-like peptidase domain-containing protein [Terriglobales bacterium]|nr:trypsin-like peptidase domain-containing protein [Terriglobales bacterium]